MTEHKAAGAVFIWQRMCHILKSNSMYGVCMVYVWCMVWCMAWFDLPLWRGGQGKWQLTPDRPQDLLLGVLNKDRNYLSNFSLLLRLNLIRQVMLTIVEMGIKGSVKSPHLPSRYPQPQPKKNLIAYRRHLDSLLELHSTVSFSNLKHCGRRR